jgi:hypothetical protein
MNHSAQLISRDARVNPRALVEPPGVPEISRSTGLRRRERGFESGREHGRESCRGTIRISSQNGHTNTFEMVVTG